MEPHPGSFVEWRHAQVSTPRPVLTGLVRAATGSPPELLRRIVEGYENEVHRVRCADGQDVVIRILRWGGDSTRSAGEARAMEQARAAGVPVPEILLHDTVRIDGAVFPVMVQRAVPGRPLSQVLSELSGRQRHRLLVEIGRLARLINSVPVEAERDWASAMADDLADRRGEADRYRTAGFAQPQVERMLRMLREYVEDFPCERWVLCHGDLSPRHIFVRTIGAGADAADPVTVSGIVDFGDWKPGASVHDLAVLRVRGPDLELRPLLDGYGAPDDTTYRRRLDLHTLAVALPSLSIGVGEDDHACVERVGTLVRLLLQDLADSGPGRPDRWRPEATNR